MPQRTDVLIMGAGQAGLSVAYHLKRIGVAHHIVDAEDGPGGAWRHRWPTLTMGSVNGIRELPGSDPPYVDPMSRASSAIPAWFGSYERDFAISVQRPIRVRSVRPMSDGSLLVTAHVVDTSETQTPRPQTSKTSRMAELRWSTRAIANATGTWRKPFWPAVPGRENFAGWQLHTHDYPGPEPFRGRRVIVVGGGISAVQHLLEIAPLAAGTRWITRRPPIFTEGEFSEERGRAAVEMVAERVRHGLAPQSVVGVTGLPLTPQLRAGLAAGLLDRLPMFSQITPHGVVWADGRRCQADVILWATGFRAALDHLAPLRLREPGGGIAMDGARLTRVRRDHRVHLVGYGPGASTIGANRAGRAAARELAQLLAAPPTAAS